MVHKASLVKTRINVHLGRVAFLDNAVLIQVHQVDHRAVQAHFASQKWIAPLMWSVLVENVLGYLEHPQGDQGCLASHSLNVFRGRYVLWENVVAGDQEEIPQEVQVLPACQTATVHF